MDEVFKRDENYRPTTGGVSETSDEIRQFKFDETTERALIDSTSEEQGHGSVGDGLLSLTTANSTVQISATQACKRVFITAHEGNRGVICIGGVNVSGTISTRTGKTFYPSQGDWFKVSNLNLLYAVADTANSTLTFYYEN